MKKLLSIILSLAVIVSLTACGGSPAAQPSQPQNPSAPAPAEPAAEPITLRYASVYTQDSTFGQGMEKFKEIVEERSGGTILIDPYYDGVLGAETDMIQSQKEGGIEIAFSGSSGIGLYIPAFQILESWYAYDSIDGVRGVFQTIFDQLDAACQENGFKLIGAFFDGNRSILSQKPATCLADMKGLKMRSPTNAMFTGCIEALGAQAISMPMNDVYTSLQTGAIEACDGYFDTLYTYKWYEQAKCLILDSHTWSPMAVTVNLDTWNSLTAEQQDLLLAAADEATNYQLSLWQDRSDQVLAEMKEAGLEVYELTDREDWIAATKPVVDKLANEYGQLAVDFLQAIRDAQ